MKYFSKTPGGPLEKVEFNFFNKEQINLIVFNGDSNLQLLLAFQ